MNKRCKHIRKDGFQCGSHAFNLYMNEIEQGDLCDVHYWEKKAQRTWVGLDHQDKKKFSSWLDSKTNDEVFTAIDDLLRNMNT
jgi:hypothetical protein